VLKTKGTKDGSHQWLKELGSAIVAVESRFASSSQKRLTAIGSRFGNHRKFRAFSQIDRRSPLSFFSSSQWKALETKVTSQALGTFGISAMFPPTLRNCLMIVSSQSA